MNSLFANNHLRNWSIFEEKNGAIVVRLRFDDSVTNSENESTNGTHVSFKRKSERQMRRDRNRAARHKDTYVGNRSVQDDDASPELPRHAEQNISDTTPLDFSPVELLNSSANTFAPNNSPVKHDGEQHIPGQSTKLNSSFVSVSSLQQPDFETNSLMREEVSCEIDTEYADSYSSMTPIPHDISTSEDYDDNDDSHVGLCNDEACSYGSRDLVGVCFVNISVCHKCKDFYLCEECLIKGRHRRHRPFIGPSIPFLIS